MSEFTSCDDCARQGKSEGEGILQYCYSCVHQDREDLFKPKPKKIIDLSMMVGSGIDMEFSTDKRLWIISKYQYKTEQGFMSKIGPYAYCRIRQDHWHSWQGGECPLPEGLKISVLYRNEGEQKLLTKYVGKSFWVHDDDYSSNWDIIAFKVLGTANSWKYEWE